MADLDMTDEEREAFLADVHVGVLSISRDTKGPLALPIWYLYDGGDVVIHMAGDSLKAKLLRKTGRATMTVQSETPPYRYVMIEGAVVVKREHGDGLALATRYLGAEFGKWYVDNNPQNDESVIARLTPDRWITCDYNKAMGPPTAPPVNAPGR